ncbi:MAG: sulfatase [Desulfobacteraceae bacterium]|nr:sulfatase [Desulfobacteraceae bacterium]
MKIYRTIGALRIAIIAGFAVGLVPAIRFCMAQKYIQYRIFRLVAIVLQKSINKWIATTIIAALALSLIVIITKWVWKSLSANGVKGGSKNKLSYAERFKALASTLTGKIALVLVVLLVILNLGVGIDGKINAPKGPNVILIVCETMRPDHYGCYGYKRDTTKNVDLLANDAFVFRNAYTQAPSTWPAMWNILTSKYKSSVPAEDQYVTIAEYFKSHNYKTGAFLSHHYFEGSWANVQQGFDVYDAECEKDVHGMSARRAGSITEATIRWIEQNKREPFFLWLLYFDPHDPYVPAKGFAGYYNKNAKFSGDRRAQGIGYRGLNNRSVTPAHKEFLINAYDEEIRYEDHEVGKLFSYLKSTGLYDNSIIVFTADHGEELGDNNDRWDHCQLLSQEEIWIPLLIKLPHQSQKIEIESAVQNIDIYPSLVEYFDASGLPNYYKELEGTSLMPFLNKEQLDNGRHAASFWHNQLCIVKGDYKYWIKGGKDRLVNIRTGQIINDPAMRAELRSALGKIYNQYIADIEDYQRTVENLKSIGYLR